MSRGRYRQIQWEAREEAILEALARLSAERGFPNVTMDDLAEEVGISKATLYQHFESKDALLVHLILKHYRQFAEWLETTAGQPPLERLRAIMHYLMVDHVMTMRGMLSLGREHVMPVFLNTPELVAQHNHSQQVLHAIIRQGQAEGNIARDLAPQTIVNVMWALSNVVFQPAASDFVQGHTPAADELAGQLQRMFERSLRPD